MDQAAQNTRARNDEAKEIGAIIWIGSRQPKNLLRLVGGYKAWQGVSKMPPDAGCFKCQKCRMSWPILHETINVVLCYRCFCSE